VWAAFARAVLDEAGRSDVPVARITAVAAGRAAKRPPYSYLDGSRFAATVGQPLSPWRDALRRFLRECPKGA
jgi:dTDP-4-dehydrorhamnose reductase